MNEQKFICKKCGCTEYIVKEKPNGTGVATGLYCAKCGTWQKWLNKQEKVLYNSELVGKQDDEQGTRKKIIKIIAQYVSAWGEDEAIANALIAAGMGDVKEAKKEVEYWKSEVKTARADIDAAVKEITERIFTELRDCFAEQSAYAVDCNQHTGYYDYEIKASDVVCDIVSIAEKYGVELGAKDND